jgi:hypothetical protein
MHYKGGTSHIPQTQRVPHCTPRATNGKEHRENLSPHQPTSNTRRPLSCNPPQPRRQRPQMSKDPVAAPHGELDTTAHRPHRTCWTCQVPKPKLRLHTGGGGDIDPSPEGKNTENKAQRQQERGKGTPGEDPIARRNGCGGPTVPTACPNP